MFCASLAALQVGDFGLSLKMDHTDTHISSVYQGTLTHMAPGGRVLLTMLCVALVVCYT
jgi:hypothetical protein